MAQFTGEFRRVFQLIVAVSLFDYFRRNNIASRSYNSQQQAY